MGVRTELYLGVYNLLSSDVSTYGASSSTITIYGGFPDIETQTFPSIVIEPIQSNELGETKTIDVNREVSSKIVPVIIHIFAKRNRDLDIIADGIVGSLKTKITGYLLNDVSDSNGFIQANEQKLKLKTLTCTYMQR
jgi:hypothetical protein